MLTLKRARGQAIVIGRYDYRIEVVSVSLFAARLIISRPNGETERVTLAINGAHQIGEEISIQLSHATNKKATLAISAPWESVYREEVYIRRQQQWMAENCLEELGGVL